MKFSLSAYLHTETGKYVASLYHRTTEGKSVLVETKDDLRSVKAVKGWAKNAAEHYKKTNLPTDTESHSVSATLHI